MSEIAERAAALRAAFDRTFAEAPAPPRDALAGYLAIRVGNQRRAVVLADVSALHVDRRIAPLPSEHSALLGLAGVRGAILPVYDLRVLLDEARSEPPRWMIVAACAPVAFAFDGFEGLLRVPQVAVAAGAAEIVSSDDLRRVVLSMSQLVNDIRSSEASDVPTER